MLMTDSYYNYLNFFPFYYFAIMVILKNSNCGENCALFLSKKKNNLQQCFNYVTKIDKGFFKNKLGNPHR